MEWVAIPFSKGSSQPRDWPQVSHIEGSFFTVWATREAVKQHDGASHLTLWALLASSKEGSQSPS